MGHRGSIFMVIKSALITQSPNVPTRQRRAFTWARKRVMVAESNLVRDTAAASAAAHEAAHMDANASTVTAPPRPIAAARPRRTSGSDARDLERLFTDSRALFSRPIQKTVC